MIIIIISVFLDTINKVYISRFCNGYCNKDGLKVGKCDDENKQTTHQRKVLSEISDINTSADVLIF